MIDKILPIALSAVLLITTALSFGMGAFFAAVGGICAGFWLCDEWVPGYLRRASR